MVTIPPAPEVAPHNVTVVRSEDGLSMRVSFQRLSLVEAKRLTLYYFVSYTSSPGSLRRRQSGGGQVRVPDGESSVEVSGLDPDTEYEVTVFTASDEEGRESHSESEPSRALPFALQSMLVLLVIICTISLSYSPIRVSTELCSSCRKKKSGVLLVCPSNHSAKWSHHRLHPLLLSLSLLSPPILLLWTPHSDWPLS